MALGAAVASPNVAVQVIVFVAVVMHKVERCLLLAVLHLTPIHKQPIHNKHSNENPVRLSSTPKAPAAFGMVSFLVHMGVEKKLVQGHLLAFSAAAPIFAISTYFILTAVRNALHTD